ncbi:RHS repeat-associated core domain-containing protein [Flavobacterium sp. CS20]|nr:RHS repeat-associated core domain-containing protein [Flavobacterium sp. CS20]
MSNYDGDISQHAEYLPFGELLTDEHLNSHNTRYKYNGKEFDQETGNYYYGARYYNPKTSLWLSVDPLTEKYPEWSPYNYTMNNPIRYTDPTGMAPEQSDWIPKVNEDGSTSYIAEKGDNASTLASQYDLDQDVADNLYSTMENGEISGSNVKVATGSEVMKLDLSSPEGKSSQRRFDHFLFARDHTSSEGGWAFLSTDYYSNTQYKDVMSGWAKMNVGDDSFSVNYAIPLYRSATFDKSSTATALGISPLRAKPAGRTSLFSNQDNMRFLFTTQIQERV